MPERNVFRRSALTDDPSNQRYAIAGLLGKGELVATARRPMKKVEPFFSKKAGSTFPN